MGGTQVEPRGGPPSSPEAPRVKRKSPCKWISWDDEGRPSCEHGPAYRAGHRTSSGAQSWRCRLAHDLYQKAYQKTPAGKATRARANQQPHTKSRKAFYEVAQRAPRI